MKMKPIAVLLLLCALCLCLSPSLAKEKRGLFDQYLNNFDLDCLNTLLDDQAAIDALTKLQKLNLQNPNVSAVALVDLEALELSDHLVCSAQTSALCGEVQALPPRNQSRQLADLIAQEFQTKTDEQLLAAFKYDINSLCASLTELDDALEPHKACISTNLAALAGLPSAIRAAIIEAIEQSTGGKASPLNYNLTAVLELSKGCEDFKAQVVSTLRDQMTSDFWNLVLLGALTQYDLQAFDDEIELEKNLIQKSTYGCTIPSQLICTKNSAQFYSACQLNTERDFDFKLSTPIDGSVDVGSSYTNSYLSFSESTGGEYPCLETFQDPCFGAYLKDSPSIPNLALEMTCRMPGFYYSLTGETPPPNDDMGDGDMGGGNGDNGDNGDNDDDGSENGGNDNGNDNDNDNGEGGDDDGNNGGNDGGSTGGKGESQPMGLSSGGVAAIVIAVVGTISAAGVIGFFFLKKRKLASTYQVQLE